MRWTELFDDLEGEASALQRAERNSEVADRTRAEVGRLTLLNRLRSSTGREVSLFLTGTGHVSGLLERVGVDWLLLTGGQDVLVPMAAVAFVADLPHESVSPAAVGAVASRLTFSSALRVI